MADINANPILGSINSDSKTALYKLLAGVFAIAAWALEVLFDILTSETDTKIDNSEMYTVPWYYQKCLDFQYGDQLVWDGQKFAYPVIDDTKKIIKRVAVTPILGGLRIRVAKGTDELYDDTELDAFKAYISGLKYPGTKLNVYNYRACLVRYTFNMVYDAMVLTPDGNLIADGSEIVKTAVQNYLFGISYGGKINRTKQIDAIENLPGVIDISFDDFEVQEYGATDWTIITSQNFEAISGCYTLDTLTLNANPNV